MMRQTMVSTYPQLEGVRVETAWSGLMAYARHLMPLIGQLQPGIWYVFGFGGRGLNTTAIGGRVIAEGILGTSDRYRLYEPFGLVWNGGPFGVAAAQLTYWTYQAMDLAKERRAARDGLRYDCVSGLPNRARGACGVPGNGYRPPCHMRTPGTRRPRRHSPP